MSRVMASAALLIALVASACRFTDVEPEPALTPTWVDAWQAVPTGTVPNRCSGRQPLAAFPNGVGRSQTIRTAIRPLASGSAIKVRLSNRFSTTPLVISHATVATAASGASVAAGSIREVRFNAARRVTIAPMAEATSDAVTIEVAPGRRVVVSVAIASGGPLTWHAAAETSTYATAPGTGDHTLDTKWSAYEEVKKAFVVVAGLQVRATRPTTAIVALGDSITDGGDADPSRHWTGVLANRLRSAGVPRTVLAAGIECNALLRGSAGGGPQVSERFTPDVLERVGASHVVLFIGTNDLAAGATAQAVIDELSALAQRARDAGLRVLGATIIPNNVAPSPERRPINRWIRTTPALDGFVDFDAAIRDPRNPDTIKPAFNGDGIHPNAAGQVAMGKAISLSLFAGS